MTRQRPRVLLKARPTLAQLQDRLAPPVPDGMELYLHEDDLAGAHWLSTLAARFARVPVPPGFTWIVEGPLWSLDGELFGLCRDAEADREVIRRLVQLARRLGARAVNIHCVAGSTEATILGEVRRRAAIEQALPFLEWYVRACADAGIQPLIENVPPICRMRRAAFVYTPVGVEPDDLLACVRRVPGLSLTLDTSHAQLAVNAFRGTSVAQPTETAAVEPGLGVAAAYYRGRGGPRTLLDYVEPLLPWIVNVHVSNAAGLLAEGLPYDEGEADLDAVVRRLAPVARFFVTEPIDADDDHAALKRQMQRRLAAVLGISLRDGPPPLTPLSRVGLWPDRG